MVGVAGREPEHPLALRGDEDRQVRAAGRREQDRVVDARPIAARRDPFAVDERRDDPDGLLEPADPMVERVAERVVFGLVPAAAQAEDQPASGNLIGGRGHLGQEARIPEGRREHERPELDPLGDRRNGGQERPGLVDPDLVAVILAEEEVVADPQAVDPARLGMAGERRDLRPAAAFAIVRGLRQHDSDLHRLRV